MAGRPKKRRAEEEDEDNGNVLTHKMVRAPPPPQQDMYDDVIDELPPLGLQLKRSVSFMDLVHTVLSKPKSASGQSDMANIITEPLVNKAVKSETLTAGERLKASKFHANFLKIGSWECTSQYEGDLVAKCYYGRHKLIWEVLNSGLKSKMELQWSHITTLKATYLEDGDGILDLVLSEPPLFYKEIIDHQPSKHTLWQRSADFTGGQASAHRRHILKCPSSLLKNNFEKLIRCDQRLNQLSQQQVIVLDSPVFETRSSILKNTNKSDGLPLNSTQLAPPCVVSSMSKNDEVMQPEVFSLPMNLDVQANYAAHKPDVFSLPMNLGSATSDVQVKYVAEQQNNSNLCDLAVPMSMDVSLSHLDNFMLEQTAAHNPPLHNIEVPSKEFLEFSERLLSDTHGPPSVDENYVMARVDSLGSLLEKDKTSFTIPVPERNDTILADGVCSPGGRTTYSGGPPFISKKDSSTDLLEKLPRIESSEFLFNILEDLENAG